MKRFILTAVSFMTLLCSCENFIDLQPMDKITMDDYWSTSTELEYYTRQFYPSFCPWTQMVAEMATDNDDMITGSPRDRKSTRLNSSHPSSSRMPSSA